MSLYKSHQTHVNITEARNHAVKLMTRKTGLSFFVVSAKTPKCRVIDAIKRGVYDGWYYSVDFNTKNVYLGFYTSKMPSGYTHKIGN